MPQPSIFPLRRNLFTIGLAALLLTGAFSRFTHGKYTPNFYAYQEYHQEDDGSVAAQITPMMDVLLATLLFVPQTRFLSALAVNAFFGLGLGVQLKAGKRFEIDILTIILAVLAIAESRNRK